MENIQDIIEKLRTNDFERASSNLGKVLEYLTQSFKPEELGEFYENFIALATVSVERYPAVRENPLFLLAFIYSFKMFLVDRQKEIEIVKNIPDIEMEFV